VVEAASGGEAIEAFRRHPVDAVLTDLGLPDMPGEAVIAHVRAASGGRTPVMVVSGAAQSDVGAERLGADAVLRKPVDGYQLVSHLARCTLEASGPRRSPSRTEARKGMTVLIIEDDAAMRQLLRDVLERAGHRVIERADGTDLPEIAEHEAFDAVVLDKEMPGASGLDLLSYLRRRLPAVPVIFVTAFGGPAVAEEAARRGAFSYLEKPFRVSAVLETLETVPMLRAGGSWRRG
jgi:CheY-like chemotaxis protein